MINLLKRLVFNFTITKKYFTLSQKVFFFFLLFKKTKIYLSANNSVNEIKVLETRIKIISRSQHYNVKFEPL